VFSQALSVIRRESSGARALANVAEIVRHHRIQASPGYREAARWCGRAFQSAGLSHRIHSFPYDGARRYWTSDSFEEWNVKAAFLDLVAPQAEARRLCDFDECKISLIQRSAPTPPQGVEAELVVLDQAERPESYASLDLRGKLVLVRGDLEQARAVAVGERGAIGLLSDAADRPLDLPDARKYTSFWWGETGGLRCFGFVLSPRQGQWLRELASREAEAGRAVRLGLRRRAGGGAGALDARVRRPAAAAEARHPVPPRARDGGHPRLPCRE
jgi:hypothetical protein